MAFVLVVYVPAIFLTNVKPNDSVIYRNVSSIIIDYYMEMQWAFDGDDQQMCKSNISTNNAKQKGSVNTITENSFNKNTLFKFLPVELRGPKGSLKVIAFIDEGSKISLIEEEVTRRIGLQGQTSNLCLGWIGGRTTNETSKKVNMEIGGTSERVYYQMKNVYTTTNLKLPPEA